MIRSPGALLLLLRLLARRRRPIPARTVAERLAMVPCAGAPVRAPVTLHWSAEQVPHVVAQHDEDAAVGLGVVHAHLRWAQMEMLRAVAWGRLSRWLGPVAVDLDHALLALDLPRAVPAIEAALPPATRSWVDGFVAGINHYQGHAPAPPPELALLGIGREPWSRRDVLAVGRLAGADVNWLLWPMLLRARRRRGWPAVWASLVREGRLPPLGTLAGGDPLARLLAATGRFASNAVAIGPARSATGAPWVAGDTHLSVGLPNLWLIGAVTAPSINVVGLMIPGIPAVTVGRNRWIAWGGTNLHAASSDLFALDPAAPVEPGRAPRIAVRWSRPRQRRVRESAAGPVISDARLLRGGEPIAFRWIGHRPSDELSALLALDRARDGRAVAAALDGFAVPGQTFVHAERSGAIGATRAAWLPRRDGPPPDLVLPSDRLGDWDALATARDLPALRDPAGGLIVSANERPPDGPVPIGWFFAPPDRAARLAALIDGAASVDLALLVRLQTDVVLPAAAALSPTLQEAVRRAGVPGGMALADALARWDGRYDPGSAGALAYELLLHHLSMALPRARRQLAAGLWTGRSDLRADVAALLAADRRPLARAIRRSAAGLRRFGNWGALHRLRLAHPLAALPLVGRAYRTVDRPSGGTADTLLKTAHPLTARPHAVTYGSNARYAFDLSDPDGNHLVLLGGQDGWIGSASALDQLPLWERGEALRVPLAAATAARDWPHHQRLTPP